MPYISCVEKNYTSYITYIRQTPETNEKELTLKVTVIILY